MFGETSTRLDNGIQGEPVEIHSGDPLNYYQAISETSSVPGRRILSQLFVPQGEQLPVVIVVPGSLGVAPSHLQHAQTLCDHGFATLVIDPFGSRKVTSTVANQAQYSFAASAWDVLAAAQRVREDSRIDSNRVGAQGHSRGGSAVVTAAMRPLQAAMQVEPLAAVYGAYPWCGQQFTDPDVGQTRVRSIIGDRDEWCLPQQVQAYMHAISLAGGHASCRVVSEAHHSFDRGTAIELIPDASVSPAAPTTYINEVGRFIHPVDGLMSKDTTDRDMMLYGIKSGYGVRGARIGGSNHHADLFTQDMLEFWQRPE